MCLGGSAPAPKDPEKPQEAKMAEQGASSADGNTTVSDARKKAAQTGGAATSTLLTGPSGVENSSMSLGRATLLGQ